MNDGVEEAGAADVATAPGVVPEPVRPLRDVEEADVGSDRLAVLADLFIAESFIKARSREENLRFKSRGLFVSDRHSLFADPDYRFLMNVITSKSWHDSGLRLQSHNNNAYRLS